MVIGGKTTLRGLRAAHACGACRLWPPMLSAAFALACALAICAAPGAAFADGGQHEADGTSPSATSGEPTDPFEGVRGTVYMDALEELAGLLEADEERTERDLARYLQETKARHAERRARWELARQWEERFPAGDYSDVLFIGDSIMDESRYGIMAAMPGCEVNADSGRTLEQGGLIREDSAADCGVLDHIRSDDGTHERYVIGTGNNDAGGVSLYAGEEIVDRLGPDKEIYFVTEMVTANMGGTQTTNATIDALVEAYPNVHKIDWYGFVEGREREFLRDWCHPSEYGKPEYVDVLKAGVDACYAL